MSRPSNQHAHEPDDRYPVKTSDDLIGIDGTKYGVCTTGHMVPVLIAKFTEGGYWTESSRGDHPYAEVIGHANGAPGGM